MSAFLGKALGKGFGKYAIGALGVEVVTGGMISDTIGGTVENIGGTIKSGGDVIESSVPSVIGDNLSTVKYIVIGGMVLYGATLAVKIFG